MIKIIVYNLAAFENKLYPPNQIVGALGLSFDGGHYGRSGRMLGYIEGDEALIDIAVEQLSAFDAEVLTELQACGWADAATPINKLHDDGIGDPAYAGPAEIVDGRVVKPTSTEPYTSDVSAGLKELQKKVIRENAEKEIIAKWPEFKQRNAALGILSEADIAQLKIDIQATIDASNIKEEASDSATSKDNLPDVKFMVK